MIAYVEIPLQLSNVLALELVFHYYVYRCEHISERDWEREIGRERERERESKRERERHRIDSNLGIRFTTLPTEKRVSTKSILLYRIVFSDSYIQLSNNKQSISKHPVTTKECLKNFSHHCYNSKTQSNNQSSKYDQTLTKRALKGKKRSCIWS